jgi:hypothetical protein
MVNLCYALGFELLDCFKGLVKTGIEGLEHQLELIVTTEQCIRTCTIISKYLY